MKFRTWKHWGIRGRLLTIAVVPATIMFAVISLALYFASRDEIRSDIEQRGSLLAAALAESSQYAVVSGNTAALDQTLRGLIAGEQGLIAIEIIDPSRTAIVSVGDARSDLSDLQVFETPIRTQVPDVDLFDKAGRPHVSSPAQQNAEFRAGEAAGYVRVIMSALPVLEAKRERLYLSLAIVLLATIFSGLAGLYLAQRLRQPLTDAMTALRGIREGRYDVEFAPTQAGELGELQATIADMATALSNTRQELENQVAIRTSALQNAIELANQADDEKRRLIAEGNVLVEEERRRIAIEIHDHLNASLLFVKFEAQRVATLSSTLLPTEDAEVIEKAARHISVITEDLYNAARNIIKQLRPEVIDVLGLKGAVQELIRNYERIEPNCQFSLQAEAGFPHLNPQLTIVAYRVTQEALANVVKHASASHCTVTLWRNQKQGTVCIAIEDDGTGFNAKKRTSTGIGLIGMRERVSAVGGSIKVTSALGSGTKVTIEFPTQAA